MGIEFNPFDMSWLLIAAMATTAAIALAVPVVASWIGVKRLNGSFKYIALGAATFLVFQVLTRIPMVSLGGYLLQDAITESTVIQWVWIVALSFSAGLFEEGGRWVAFRWGFKADEAVTWDRAVLMGIGHGGFEAMLLVGVGVGATLLVMLFMSPEMLGADPAALTQLEAAAQQTWWMPLLGGWERVMSMLFHVALSVMVAQFWIRGGWKWVVGAMVIHGLGNLIVVGALQLLSKPFDTEVAALAAEGLMLVIGLASFAWLRMSRDQPSGQDVDGPLQSG